MESPPFRDRPDAGKQLAKKLSYLSGQTEVIVLALPRGGVPVGFEIAQKLSAPLDLMLVRKLGVPGQEELAMGAIALPDIRVFNRDVVESYGLTRDDIDYVVEKERKELVRRNQIYRYGKEVPDLKGKTIILVDDGIATGADMRAALEAVNRQNPSRVVVAVPVAPKGAIETLKSLNADVVCLHTPEMFFNVGQAYSDFGQTGDEEVLALLGKANSRTGL